jgi:hypothetical protein
MRCGGVCIGVAAALALGASPAEARRVTGEDADGPGFETQVGFGALQPGLGNLVFEGDGHLQGSPAHERVRGRDAGLQRPTLGELDLRLSFRFARLLVVGAFFDRYQGDLGWPESQTAAGQGLDSSVTGLAAGGHAGLVWSLGPYEARLGADVGVRSLGVIIRRFDLETCSSRGGTYPCPPVATATQFVAEPRMMLGVHLGRWVTAGAFGGIDLASGLGWSAGGWAALHPPFWSPPPPEGPAF